MKIVKIVLGVLTLILWTWVGQVWNGFASRNPAEHPPTVDSYVLHTHGATSYLTRSESHLLFGLMVASAVCFVGCGLAALAEHWPRTTGRNEREKDGS